MLCLSRKLHEAIVIGDEVKVIVAAVKGDKVRLLIQAPREVPVHRLEVYTAIQNEQAKGGDHASDE